ncbi:MAG: 30S ribosomal protein S17 [Planctomycetota bacterium]
MMTNVEQPETGGGTATTRRHRRTKLGVVERAGQDNTIKVRIDRLIRHPKYGKYLRRRGTLLAHDEKNEAGEGDVVELMECRPISKRKSWRLSKIVKKAVEA